MAPKNTTEILKNLRKVMRNTKYVQQSLQAYIIPSTDAHQSEMIQEGDMRRAFVSGFTGSLGTAVVTETQAALWTDGRYYLQAEKELDSNWVLMKQTEIKTPTISQFLCDVLAENSYIGVDPYLTSLDKWKSWSKDLEDEGHTLVAVDTNLIDVIWDDRPPRPINKIEVFSAENAGKCWTEKVLEIQSEMKSENAEVLVVTALDEIAWLFNLRGSDIPFNPVFFSYAIVTLDSAILFVDSERLTADAKDSLLEPDSSMFDDCRIKVSVQPYNSILITLREMLKNVDQGKIWISESSSYAVISCIPKKRRCLKDSPIAAKKAVKTEVELLRSKSGHIRDAVALCEFFHWLTENVASQHITEIDAAKELEKFKKDLSYYAGPSFPTISCSGPNASIVHYRPNLEMNRRLCPEELFLCDCGSQYRDGSTTDVTRTVHFGTPSSFEKYCYTLVLKGHIALSSAVFPIHIRGSRLDSFARKPLWDAGLDYLHGTGHGVGAYLNVHEGPIGIGSRPVNNQGLEPGMILSIEPGFYKDGKFGIRLENLAYVVKAETEHSFNDTEFLTFEPLTLVPFQAKLIDPSLLTEKEIQWLNDYHSTCREVVGKALEESGKMEAFNWLLKETQPLG